VRLGPIFLPFPFFHMKKGTEGALQSTLVYLLDLEFLPSSWTRHARMKSGLLLLLCLFLFLPSFTFFLNWT
jgi:hypothetical protein